MFALKVLLLLIFGGVGFTFSYASDLPANGFYGVIFCGVLLFFRPTFLISPLAIIHVYYFVFYLLAPTFAEIHAGDRMESSVFYYAYGMVFLTHLFAAMGAEFGEKKIQLSHVVPQEIKINLISRLKLLSAISILYITSTVLVAAVVLSSGGFAHWLKAPGDAFLNRSGSGGYVILSHFATFVLASLVGYWGIRYKSVLSVFIFLVWLFVTSPVHGSKQLISIILALALVPWIFNVKLITIKSVLFGFILLLVFFLGLYFRNISWMRIDDVIPYSLNYFTALRNLVILINDFELGFMETFFLPFNKFLTPFGLSRPDLYFDMNHLLTDVYFPSAWAIRATEQWPVEADLYLNFYFAFGLPLIFLYFLVVGRIYGKAIGTRNLGLWVASLLLIFSIPSHLRGSLFNHVDFYFYPMIFLIFIILRRFEVPDFSKMRGNK